MKTFCPKVRKLVSKRHETSARTRRARTPIFPVLVREHALELEGIAVLPQEGRLLCDLGEVIWHRLGLVPELRVIAARIISHLAPRLVAASKGTLHHLVLRVGMGEGHNVVIDPF